MNNTIPSHRRDEILNAYLIYYRTKNKEYAWAWDEVDQMRTPEHLPFVVELIHACRDDDEIAYVAAGPLKEIFIKYHLEIKETLNLMVRQDKLMREAIQAMLISPSSPEGKTLDEILKKYGLRR